MTLREYLTENKIRVDAFADAVGCTPNHLSRIMAGSQYSGKPSGSLLKMIIIETNGAVDGSQWGEVNE